MTDEVHPDGGPVDDDTGGMRLDLVRQPARYPRTPLLALLIIAVVPAVALLVLFRWTDDRADSYDSARELEALDAPPTTVDSATDDGEAVADEPMVEALDVELFDYRRAPEPIALVASVNRLAEAVEPVFTFVSSDSCAAISVDGVDAASFNPDLPVIPASNQKLLTALAAWEVLGPEHRFVTRVTAPPIVDGVVSGDLYLIGGGDPLLTTADFPIEDDVYPAFNTTSLDALADAVVAAGVQVVGGAVVGDGTRYDDEYAVDGWGPGVAFVDAGPYDALFVNDGRELGNSGPSSDPVDAAADEFERLLEARGVIVTNGSTIGVADPAAAEIAAVQSAPLADVLAEMLTNSDNNTAELMVKEIGVADSGEGSRAAGLTAMDRVLRERGVPMDGVAFFDGSGLSPQNRVTCATVLEVVHQLAATPVAGGMAVAGERGTLALEFVDNPVAGRLTGKTGTLNNEPFDADPPAVKALAGYLDQGEAGTVEFALILNTPDVTVDDKFRPLWLALAERLDTFPSGPSAGELGPARS
ncbi:MAG: D-alanyl-D-alanine carboxypeptidase/D-alanyl-D-alanine-endopeptidase [Actinomycetota bacterium]